ncbi:MAG: amidase [Pseudomonadota bacterium]
MHDPVNAFVNDLSLPGAPEGPLVGLTLGVKDLYDIEGHITGCGNPDWVKSHGPANQTAPAVRMLLDAGASLVGKTHTDEIAYSLMGANAHYGTPVNTAAPERVPGGSSSGSAAAVAAGLVDIGLGSDTGGSVRMPASFCGLWGIRPTHGVIPLDCVMPLAPSFDTAGWFTRDPDLLARVGEVLGLSRSGPLPDRLLMPVDVWAAVPGSVVEALAPAVQKLQSAKIAEPFRLSETPSGDWLEMFKVCQAAEVWEVHGAWVETESPDFGPGVRDRFAMAKALAPDLIATMRAQRKVFAAALHERLPDGAVMIVPSAPGPAPLRTAEESELDGFRMAALKILCPAGLAGLPQLSMPMAEIEGAPIGLSIVGSRGSEGTLFKLAQEMAS